MIIEGIGREAPAVVKVKLDNSTLRFCLDAARERAAYRGYKKGQTVWKRGLKPACVISGFGTITQEERPIFMGCLGEAAFIQIISKAIKETIALDVRLKERGDGGIDFERYGLTSQIKTFSPHVGNLVRIADANERETPFTADICVFCEWDKLRTVGVRGWCWWKKDTADLTGEESPYGHFNVIVPSELLRPISALCNEYLALKELFRQ